MALLLNKISGSTLVEVLVAMTIISLVAGFTMIIFLQVSRPASSIESLVFAQQKSSEMMDTTSTGSLLKQADYVLKIGRVKLQREVIQVDADLFKVTITVSDNRDREIYSRKQMMYANGR